MKKQGKLGMISGGLVTIGFVSILAGILMDITGLTYFGIILAAAGAAAYRFMDI